MSARTVHALTYLNAGFFTVSATAALWLMDNKSSFETLTNNNKKIQDNSTEIQNLIDIINHMHIIHQLTYEVLLNTVTRMKALEDFVGLEETLVMNLEMHDDA